MAAARGGGRGGASAGAALLGALVALSALACGGNKPPPQQPAGPKPVCAVDTKPDPGNKPPKERTFTPGYWYALLLQGYYQSTGVTGDIQRPARDCRGERASMDVDGCSADTSPRQLPAEPLTTKDLVVVNLGDERRLVWAMTDKFADGQAQGPIALAEVGPTNIAVRALGVLRAFPQNISLRLEKLGDGQVLVAEGENCGEAATPESCGRAVRLVPLVGDRFMAKAIIDDHGTCLGSSMLPVRATGAATSNRAIKYRLESAVSFGAEAVTVREHLDITRPADPTSPEGSFVDRVQADRTVTMKAGELIGNGPSLLSRWLAKNSNKH